MTGFGRSEKVFANKHVVVDIRSLNSRHFDLSLRSPHYLKSKEAEIRKTLTQRIGRGKVDANFNIDFTGAENTSVVNSKVFNTYAAELTKACVDTGLSKDGVLSAVMRLPGVMNSVTEIDDSDWDDILSAFNEALDNFKNYRAEEGQVMAEALKSYTDNILANTKKVVALAPNRLERIKERLEKSMETIKSRVEVDPNRFEQELIYFIEKLDLEEEVVRLTSHCNLFNEQLTNNDGGFIGKKLGFIGQEMGREINTIGSKANDVGIQKVVVEMKDDLEKLKEQLHNVL